MEEDISPLLADIASILSDEACFVVLTSYAIRSSFLSLHHLMAHHMADRIGNSGGNVTSGELAVKETNPRHFRIGQAIFARWQG